MIIVQKREIDNGTHKEEKFSVSKVKSAMKRAFKDMKQDFDEESFDVAANSIIDYASNNSNKISIEMIQELIEDALYDTNHKDIAINYIKYRTNKDRIREWAKSKEDFIEKYKASSNTADATIDDNSNVASKNIGIMNNEIHKSDNIHISRRMVMNKLKKLYPDFDAKQYIRDLQDHIIYKHDESSFAGAVAPYCCSISMYPFLTDGLRELGGLSAAPKNLDSFCGMYINLIFAISSQFAGAVATSEFLLYFDYFARKEWGEDYYEKSDEVTSLSLRKLTVLDQIHQYWQQVVYSINQPAAARGMQAAFVNFSYFDKPFFNGMFGDFYFPDGSQPVWKSLKWLQKEFMKWFNAERTKTVLTFPVESFALVYQNGEFLDRESADFVAEEYARGHSFFTYISDTVDSLSSCCFKGDEEIQVVKDGIEKKITIRDFVERHTNTPNDLGRVINTGFQIESYNENDKSCEMADITGVLKKNYTGFMYNFTIRGREIDVTADHPFLVNHKDTGNEYVICAEDLYNKYDEYYAYSDCTNLLMFQKRCKIKIQSCTRYYVEDMPVYDIQLSKNHFFAANYIITHNCRLKNMINGKEFNFTNGNMGVMTGSKSVISLNLNRIFQDICKSASGDIFEHQDTYREGLINILDRVYKYHHAYNELLWDMYDAKLLPAYNSHFIDLNKQYLTIGLNGLNQAAEFFGIVCNDNESYKRFCQFVFGTIKEQNELHRVDDRHKMLFNTEQVPAESLAVKNYNWDKEDEYWVPNDTNLYASYIFKPNDKSVSILEKIRLHGKNYIGEYLDGGAAAHLNLEEHLSVEQYKHILKYAAENGCQYLTFNIPNSECRDCHHIVKKKICECPKCGSHNIDLYDRVIGYLTKIRNWSEGRREEQKLRVYESM